MPEQPRAKGQFLQAGMICVFPAPSGSVISHDGTLPLDSVYSQDDYPVLFQVIGTTYNDAGKGDDNATQFRTPPESSLGLAALTDAEYRIRF